MGTVIKFPRIPIRRPRWPPAHRPDIPGRRVDRNHPNPPGQLAGKAKPKREALLSDLEAQVFRSRDVTKGE
jgi:hypothetical protein